MHVMQICHSGWHIINQIPFSTNACAQNAHSHSQPLHLLGHFYAKSGKQNITLDEQKKSIEIQLLSRYTTDVRETLFKVGHSIVSLVAPYPQKHENSW